MVVNIFMRLSSSSKLDATICPKHLTHQPHHSGAGALSFGPVNPMCKSVCMGETEGGKLSGYGQNTHRRALFTQDVVRFLFDFGLQRVGGSIRGG